MDLDAVPLAVSSEDRTTAASGMLQGQKQADGRGLPCPVGAQKAEALTRLDLQVQVDEGAGRAVGLGKTGDFDCRRHRHRPFTVGAPSTASAYGIAHALLAGPSLIPSSHAVRASELRGHWASGISPAWAANAVKSANQTVALPGGDLFEDLSDLSAATGSDALDELASFGRQVEPHFPAIDPLAAPRDEERLRTKRSHSLVAVDGSMPRATARSAGRCGPLEASRTRARYCGIDTSPSCSAKDLAANATSTRLALSTASVKSSRSVSKLVAGAPDIVALQLSRKSGGLRQQ